MSTQATQPVRDQKEREAVRRARPSPLVAWICLLIVYVVWGSTYLAIRVGVETMPPLLMAAARSLVAGLIMFPLGLRHRRSAPLAPRWPSRAQWRACAAAGVLLLVGQGVVGVAGRTIPSGLALLVLAAVTGEFGSLHLGHVSARSWLALGYLIVIGSIVAFSAYGIAVRALPTPTVATYAYVNPVIAVLLGALILGERLTPAMIGGGVLVVGAVVLVVRRSPPAH